jgi:hypothetical protein
MFCIKVFSHMVSHNSICRFVIFIELYKIIARLSAVLQCRTQTRVTLFHSPRISSRSTAKRRVNNNKIISCACTCKCIRSWAYVSMVWYGSQLDDNNSENTASSAHGAAGLVDQTHTHEIWMTQQSTHCCPPRLDCWGEGLSSNRHARVSMVNACWPKLLTIMHDYEFCVSGESGRIGIRMRWSYLVYYRMHERRW